VQSLLLHVSAVTIARKHPSTTSVPTGRSREVARRLGLAKSTVSYHARRLEKQMDVRCANRFDWPTVQAYYDEGSSVRECAQVFGFSTWAWSDAVKRGEITPRPAFRPLSEVFVSNTRRNRGHLKTRLLQAGLKDGTCERCAGSRSGGARLFRSRSTT
jgi:Winged helix-turn-helix DNA-binding